MEAIRTGFLSLLRRCDRFDYGLENHHEVSLANKQDD